MVFVAFLQEGSPIGGGMVVQLASFGWSSSEFNSEFSCLAAYRFRFSFAFLSFLAFSLSSISSVRNTEDFAVEVTVFLYVLMRFFWTQGDEDRAVCSERSCFSSAMRVWFHRWFASCSRLATRCRMVPCWVSASLAANFSSLRLRLCFSFLDTGVVSL